MLVVDRPPVRGGLGLGGVGLLLPAVARRDIDAGDRAGVLEKRPSSDGLDDHPDRLGVELAALADRPRRCLRLGHPALQP
jgi:hypothetical protein